MKIFVKLVATPVYLFLILSACSKADKAVPTPGTTSKPAVPMDSKAHELEVATELYRSLVAVSKSDQEINYDLTKLYYVSPEIKKDFLATLTARTEVNNNFFKKSLQLYLQKCAESKAGTEFKVVCTSKLFALTSTTDYFDNIPTKIRPREVCDAFGDPVANLACESANNLVWTDYKLDQAISKL